MSKLLLLIEDQIQNKTFEISVDDEWPLGVFIREYVKYFNLHQLTTDQKLINYQLVRALNNMQLAPDLTVGEAQLTNGELLQLVGVEGPQLLDDIQTTIHEQTGLMNYMIASIDDAASQVLIPPEPQFKKPFRKTTTTRKLWVIGIIASVGLISICLLFVIYERVGPVVPPPTIPQKISITVFNQTNKTIICNVSMEDGPDQNVYIEPKGGSADVLLVQGTYIITVTTCSGTEIDATNLASIERVWEVYGWDWDSDRLTDAYELDHDINPHKEDSDNDGLGDGDEVIDFGTNPQNEDTDDDGLADEEEIRYHSDPLNTDSDNDGLMDGEEIYSYPRYPSNPLYKDSDGDGLTDYDEYAVVYPLYGDSTDPDNPDTDDDKFGDGQEIDELKTNPLDKKDPGPPFLTVRNSYTNIEAICDVYLRPADSTPVSVIGLEVHAIKPGEQFRFRLTEGTYHMSAETCNSEIVDPRYNIPITTSTAYTWVISLADQDKDGLSDDYEKEIDTDPRVRDTDHDGLSDGEEFQVVIDLYGKNSHPLEWDSDGDDYRDGNEIDFLKTNPRDPNFPPNPPNLIIENDVANTTSICEVLIPLKTGEEEHSSYLIKPGNLDTFWVEAPGDYAIQVLHSFDCANDPQQFIVTKPFSVTATGVFTLNFDGQ